MTNAQRIVDALIDRPVATPREVAAVLNVPTSVVRTELLSMAQAGHIEAIMPVTGIPRRWLWDGRRVQLTFAGRRFYVSQGAA